VTDPSSSRRTGSGRSSGGAALKLTSADQSNSSATVAQAYPPCAVAGGPLKRPGMTICSNN
jgi:hypothetical protein